MTAGFTIRRALAEGHAGVARELADYLSFIGDALDADSLDQDKLAFSATGPQKEAGSQLEELRAGSWGMQPGSAGAADGDRTRLLV